MPTSLNRSALFDHTVEPIPSSTRSYLRTRSRRRLFTVLLDEFEKSGISKATLARRLDMDPALISRYLGTPANWEHDTFCDLLFAICGGLLSPSVMYPADKRDSGKESKLANPPATEAIHIDPPKKQPRPLPQKLERVMEFQKAT
jgi:hypothetical protein